MFACCNVAIHYKEEAGQQHMMWCGVVWCGVWCDVWCGVVWCDVWCGVVWCSVMCGVVWCDVICNTAKVILRL